ncbi:MAG: hypothetical protein ACMXYF_03680 [Candidatus Woesearchaeota archaeon]
MEISLTKVILGTIFLSALIYISFAFFFVDIAVERSDTLYSTNFFDQSQREIDLQTRASRLMAQRHVGVVLETATLTFNTTQSKRLYYVVDPARVQAREPTVQCFDEQQQAAPVEITINPKMFESRPYLNFVTIQPEILHNQTYACLFEMSPAKEAFIVITQN